MTHHSKTEATMFVRDGAEVRASGDANYVSLTVSDGLGDSFEGTTITLFFTSIGEAEAAAYAMLDKVQAAKRIKAALQAA